MAYMNNLKAHSRVKVISGNWKPFTSYEKCFLSHMLKTLFVLNTFEFLSWPFGHVRKRLDKKVMVDFKIYDVIRWETNNYDTNITIVTKNNIAVWKFGP